MTDLVNHPPHYEEQAIKLEPIDFCERLPFCEGNALKYCFRAGHKDGASELQDLKKALWYLKRSRINFSPSLALNTEQKEEFEFLLPYLIRAQGIVGAAAAKTLWDSDYAEFFVCLTEKVDERIKELENKKC